MVKVAQVNRKWKRKKAVWNPPSGACCADRLPRCIRRCVPNPVKPFYVRVLFGIAAAILIVGIVLNIFVGGPGLLVTLAGAAVFLVASLLGRQRR